MPHHRWAARFFFTACCLLLLSSGSATAQNQIQPRKAVFDAPFDFYISGNKLPAGQYTLDIIAPTYVMLRSQDGKVQQDLYFMQVASPGKTVISKVVFSQRDGKYYFFEVWGWFGKSQLTSFTPQAGDQNKDVPLNTNEKDAKPAPGL
jgi:hypothetical protein